MVTSINQQNNLNAFNSARDLQATGAGSIGRAQDIAASKPVEKTSPLARTNDTAKIGTTERGSEITKAADWMKAAQESLGVVNEVLGGLASTSKILGELNKTFADAMNTGENGPRVRLDVANMLGQMARMGQGQFAGLNLFNGSLTGPQALNFQIGADENAVFDLGNININQLAVNFAIGGPGRKPLSFSTSEAVKESLAAIETAAKDISQAAAAITEQGKEITGALNKLGVQVENASAVAAGRAVSDADMAKDLVNATTNQIAADPAKAVAAQSAPNAEAAMRLLID